MRRLVITGFLGFFLVISALPAWSAKPVPAPNAAQDDGSTAGVGCPGEQGVYADLSDLGVSLTTQGRPVLVTGTVSVAFGTNASIALRPTIDGVVVDGGQFALVHQTGASQGGTATLSFTRLYSMDAGSHIFRLQGSCQGGVAIGTNWLTVYELR